MIRNGVTFSIKECEMLAELIGHKSLSEIRVMKPELLKFLTEFTAMLGDNPLESHLEQYHYEDY